jgi:hypothetical protein
MADCKCGHSNQGQTQDKATNPHGLNYATLRKIMPKKRMTSGIERNVSPPLTQTKIVCAKTN